MIGHLSISGYLSIIIELLSKSGLLPINNGLLTFAPLASKLLYTLLRSRDEKWAFVEK
jgi:hypothetical protein